MKCLKYGSKIEYLATLALVVIITIIMAGVINVYFTGPEVTFKVTDVIEETAFIEITVMKREQPFNGNVDINVKKIAANHECERVLSIPVKDGKASFKIWGSHGKMSWIILRSGSGRAAFGIEKTN